MEGINMTIKICYNPDLKHYIQGTQSHNVILYNAKKQKYYDNYVRGIIDNGILYLRVYYPYADIDCLTIDKLYQASYTLLNDNICAILALIKKHNNTIIKDIVYNVDRGILEEKGLYNL